MKKFTLLLFSMAFIGLNAQDNIILNGGFENWKADETPENWFGVKTTIDSLDILPSVEAYEGEKCLNLIHSGSRHKKFTSDSLEVKKGISYKISFAYKGEGNLRTGLYDARPQLSGYSKYNDYIACSAEWTDTFQIVTAETDTNVAEIIFSVQNTGFDGVFIDDVEVIELKNSAEILSFVLDEEIEPAWISSENAQVTSTVIWGTELTSLTPSIEISEGAIITPSSDSSLNFSDGIEYLVTAEDGFEKVWNVVVIAADEPDMVSIDNIQHTNDDSGNSPLNDKLVKTKGVVTAIDSQGIFLQDGEGAWNGIYVNNDASVDNVTSGDSVMVIGRVSENNNLTEIIKLISYEIINTGNELPAAAEIASIADLLVEAYESVLIKLTEETTSFSEPDKSRNWNVKGTTDSLIISNQIIGEYSKEVGTVFTSITGIGSQNIDNYLLMPRNNDDIVIKPLSVHENSLLLINIYPNPVNNNLLIENLNGVVELKINNALGQQIMNKKATGASMTINTSDLRTGVYMITFVSETGAINTKRFIKH